MKRIPHTRTRPRHSLKPEGALDPRSYVRGSRVRLYGLDKTKLRRDARDRAEGRCEVEIDGEICGKFAAWDGLQKGDLIHLGGTLNRSDELDKVQWGCHSCHMRRDHPGVQWTPKSEAVA